MAALPNPHLESEGSTLIVNVKEQPSIAKIALEGKKDLSKEDLTLELKRQYLSHGKYSLKINTEVTELTHNRVGIRIKISESRDTKIKEINIAGNKVFDYNTLSKKLELNPSKGFGIIGLSQ